MSEPEEYMIEKLCEAMIACARARELVPSEWDDAKHDALRHQLTVAMGLLEPPGMSFSISKNVETLQWEACCYAVDNNSVDWETRCKRAERTISVATRLTGYALFGRTVLKKIGELLNSHDAQHYKHKLPAQFKEHMDSGRQALEEVLDAVGDDGVSPWL